MDAAKYLSTLPVVDRLSDDCPLNILIVEDNQINLKVLKNVLARMGFEADCCENGLQAIAAVEEKNYDLIFMDLQMPVMGGLDATRKIREKMGDRYPFISAFTANCTHSNRVSCEEVGMHDFISKPTTPSRIAEVIQAAYQLTEEQKKQDSFQPAAE